MAIALTADRFGHRRLVVLGTALCCRGEPARRLRRQRRRPAGLALLRGSGLHRRHGRHPDPGAARRPARRPAPRHDVLDVLHAGRRRLDDADRGRHPARHVVARRLAGGRRPRRRSCSRRCCCAPVPRHELDRAAGQAPAGPARDGRSGDQRRAARHRALLRRLLVLLVRRRGLPADPAGRAPGLLDLDRRHRHGAGHHRECRRQPRRRLAAAARPCRGSS